MQRDLDEMKAQTEGKDLDKLVEEQLNNGLLRMAERKVKVEMEKEELEEKLKGSDLKVKLLEEQLQ